MSFRKKASHCYKDKTLNYKVNTYDYKVKT